jgi:hypothetical protein
VKVNGVVAPMFCVDEKQLVVWSEGTNAADFTVQFLSTPFDGGDNHQFTGYKPNGVASVNDQGTVANLPDHGCYKFSVLQQDSSNYSSFSEDPIVVVNGVGGKGATALPPKRGTTQPAGQPQK